MAPSCPAIAALVLAAAAAAEESGRVRIRLDATEAEAVLAILDKTTAGEAPSEGDWRSVFESRGYQRLKRREADRNPFTDADFRQFTLTGEATGHGPELRRTLADWKGVDLDAIAARMLAYLPARATIDVTVYPVIKPRHNSFVFELDSDPAIFLYLDPQVSGPQFENTVAHELHHVGLHSLSKEMEASIAGLPEPARRAAEWMGAFGEGMAMLAAAGSPDVHPHAASKPEDRQRWDRDMANFGADLAKLNDFFEEILGGRLDQEHARERAMEFFGVQGPWYTVGYRMAAVVEKRYGRAALLRCMEDPRMLLATWNRIAGADHTWSETVLAAVHARSAQ